MEPERWHQISRIYHAAQDRPHPERAAFVRDTCAGDASLRREVESLLAYEGAAVQFLEHPPAGADRMPRDVPAAVAAIPMGTRFGSYEVVARLGAGGMGEVYRAHDSKLGRDVAIKILPRQFATHADRRARLEREARLLATLNHPHIGGIYGLEDREGVLALVLELVEGNTLAERIARGRPDKPAIKVREALSIARQIADALEAAHDKGIVHRDLKPANIKVTPTGTVKVLDFGIAKASAADASGGDQGPLPAMGAAGTGLGAVIGTPAYMSPEQALGQNIDKRTDIWAFGCVLYEVLTGRGVFGGDTPSETTAAIFDRVPDWHALPDATPSGIRRLLQRCLDRDPNRRLHDIADARLEIDDALASPETLALAATPSRRVTPVAIAALAGGAVIAALVVRIPMRPAPVAPVLPSRFAIVPPPEPPLNVSGPDRDLAFSPDGRHLVYRFGGSITGGSPLMMRAIDQLDAQPVTDVRAAYAPFFSPDSRWIGFFENMDLKKVSIDGGPVIALCPVSGVPRGASWGDDNTITFATNSPGTGLWRVSADGGEPTVLTTPDPVQHEGDHALPSALPRGRGVLFTITIARAGQADSSQVAVVDLKTGQRKILIRGGGDAQYVETGHLIFAAAGALRAVRFDPVRLEVLSDPVTVVEPVLVKQSGAANYAVSGPGTLVYMPGEVAGQVGSQALGSLVWVDRKGHEERIKAPLRAYGPPRVSPDGTRLAIGILDQGNTEIWIWDFAREMLRPLTFAPGMNGLPVWTPDSRQIIFMSDRTGVLNLYSQAADGTGTVDRLTTSANPQWPTSITPDGTRVVGFDNEAKRAGGVILVPLTSPANRLIFDKAQASPSTSRAGIGPSPGATPTRAGPVAQKLFPGVFAEISPDGRYLAYQSDESGRYEVYVRPFPQVDRGRWQISIGGGTRVAWARSGRELFYLDESNTLTRVLVSTSGPAFSVGVPTKIFDTKYAEPNPARHYDVSPDGQRFLMIKHSSVRDQHATPASMIIVLNWFEELKAKVPGGK